MVYIQQGYLMIKVQIQKAKQILIIKIYDIIFYMTHKTCTFHISIKFTKINKQTRNHLIRIKQ